MSPAEILTLDAYANCRDAVRERIIAHKRARSVQFGPAMRLQFEDVLTVRYQIQEVLRLEGADDPAIVREEIDRYAHLVPDGSCWCATLMIEEPAREARRRVLPLLHVAVPGIYIDIGGICRVAVRANEDLPRGERDRPSAVHFLRFDLGEQARMLLFSGASIDIGCEHEHYRWHVPVPPDTLGRLMRDVSRNTNPATRRPDHY